MVTEREILELGFEPAQRYTLSDRSYVMNNKTENPYIHWKELMIMYELNTGDCGIYISDSEKEIFKVNLWRGKIIDIEELEDKLQDLDYD